MMDLLAEVNGADAWIEKSPHHTFFAADIAKAAPDAQFLIVRRHIPDLVRSCLFCFDRSLRWPPMRWLDVGRGALATQHPDRELQALAKNNTPPQAMGAIARQHQNTSCLRLDDGIAEPVEPGGIQEQVSLRQRGSHITGHARHRQVPGIPNSRANVIGTDLL